MSGSSLSESSVGSSKKLKDRLEVCDIFQHKLPFSIFYLFWTPNFAICLSLGTIFNWSNVQKTNKFSYKLSGRKLG